jgi:hypothetical protein
MSKPKGEISIKKASELCQNIMGRLPRCGCEVELYGYNTTCSEYRPASYFNGYRAGGYVEYPAYAKVYLVNHAGKLSVRTSVLLR